MQKLKDLKRKLAEHADFNERYVGFYWEEPVYISWGVHYHMFELRVSFEWWAYATEKQKLKKLQRFQRYAKRQGQVLRERRKSLGRS